jgi:perosamine synthetase
MIFTSLSPNTESDDVWRAAGLLFQPWMWRKGKYVGQIERIFCDYLHIPYAFAFQSGRNALYALLQAQNLHPDDEVLLQAYTCVAVPEPVLWVGAKPVYVDVLADYTMDPADLKKRITSKSKVLIIQHTFGNAAHLEELLKIAQEHHLFVIEDCAHALGGIYNGKLLGTFGDASFFSFGRDKVISSVFGGMLMVKDEKLAQKVVEVRKHFKIPSLWYVKQQLLHPLILSVSKKTYTFSSLGKVILELSRRLHLISKAVESNELSGGKPSFVGLLFPNALAYLALYQFKKLDRYNAHRRKIAVIYNEYFLHAHPLQSIYLRYTIQVREPRKLIQIARSHGIELGDWYQQAIAPRNVEYKKVHYDPTVYMQAESLARKSINLPTHIGISEADARFVARIAKDHAD